ncbi:MAG: hypothetical protein HZA25_01785 [Candidatus Niyogibacteria bacterium]|nr:hypothetical protein [Candidatus Niyogibacteria bacterium]
MKICVLDFDGVLFDLERLARDQVDLFGSFGISEEIFWQAYARGSVVGPYSVWRHIVNSNELLPIALSKKLQRGLYKRVYELAHHSAQYVLPGAIEFLDKLEDDGWQLSLLSYGKDHQAAKIYNSGLRFRPRHFPLLGPLLDHFSPRERFAWIRITADKTKVNDWQAILRNYDPQSRDVYLFVDDTAAIVEAVRAAFPKKIFDRFFIGQLLLPNTPGRLVAEAGSADRILHSYNKTLDYATEVALTPIEVD